MKCRWVRNWLTVQHCNKSDGHHQQPNQQVRHGQRHEEVISGILEFALQRDGQDDQDVSTDGGQDGHEEEKRGPVQLLSIGRRHAAFACLDQERRAVSFSWGSASIVPLRIEREDEGMNNERDMAASFWCQMRNMPQLECSKNVNKWTTGKRNYCAQVTWMNIFWEELYWDLSSLALYWRIVASLTILYLVPHSTHDEYFNL